MAQPSYGDITLQIQHGHGYLVLLLVVKECMVNKAKQITRIYLVHVCMRLVAMIVPHKSYGYLVDLVW